MSLERFPVNYTSGGNRMGIEKVQYTHDSMIDHLIANPTISQGELAAIYGYTPSWVSQVISSDAFQARMHERREQIADPTIRATMKERFDGVIRRSLEILEHKLNKDADRVPDQLVLQAMGLASRAAGYGARMESAPAPQVNVSVYLEEHAGNLTRLLRREKTAALEPIEVAPDG